jgi:two-component system CheB/CheR fusion protein
VGLVDSYYILVVEDDADARANIGDILDLDGYRIQEASTFAEALDRNDWDRVGAILLDRRLPDSDAAKMLPRLRELAPEAPIVIVTGFPDIEGAIAALRQGAYDYLLKPIDPDVLRASLNRIRGRRATEAALQQSEAQMRAVLDTAADAIITIDRNGMIQNCNPATERLFGYTKVELTGQNVKMLMPPPYRDEHDGYLKRYLRTGEARIIGIGREVMGRRKNGSTFPIGLAVSEIPELGLFTGIIRDISERRRLQKQILEAAADEDRRIGLELHDNIQQQCTGLGLLAEALAEALAEKSLPEAQTAARLAKGIRYATEHVHLLARGLVPVEVDADGLRSALAELAGRTRDLCRLPCDFRSEQPISVGDNFVATHLYRIAQEAVNNAVKHGRPKQIEITLSEWNGDLRLQIADDGVGLGSAPASRPGLGLRLMEYRASLIGGTLRIRPQDGAGTMVICTLSRGSGVHG